MFGYIYKTTNTVNNKIYVGQKKSSVFLHEQYLGSGKRLWDAIKCYGMDKFKVELLEECDTEEELNTAETRWISELRATDPDVGYNLSAGGPVPRLVGIHNGFYGRHHTPESMAKRDETNIRKYGDSSAMRNEDVKRKREQTLFDNYGVTCTFQLPQYIDAVKQANTGRKKTESEVQKRLETMRRNDSFSYAKDPEYRKKLSEANKGKQNVKGTLWVMKENKSKMIKPEQLAAFLEDGWTRGRPSKKTRA